MIEDVIGESLARLRALKPASADGIRAAGAPVIAFSDEAAAADRAIKSVLLTRVYRHPRVMGVMEDAERVVHRLFDRYLSDSGAMPAEWRPEPDTDDSGRARRVADFLAGMTDRYALREYKRLFDEQADLG